MIDLEQQNNVADSPQRQADGSNFKEAREKRGFSTAQVAEELKIPEAYLKYLEAEQFEPLPVATFVRGYIRLYARFLELPEDEMLVRYQEYLAQQEVPQSKVIRIKRQVRPGDPIVKWTTVIIVLLALALSMLWWRSQQSANSTGSLYSPIDKAQAVEYSPVDVKAPDEAVSEAPKLDETAWVEQATTKD